MAVDRTPGSRSINQVTAMAFGAVYALVGVLGFFVTDQFVSQEGGSLLGFQVNHLHNIVHLAIGVALLAASRTLGAARSANLTIGVVYLALGVLGPFIDDTAVDIIALNGADHVLHLVSGALLTAVALGADKHSRTRV